MYIYICVNKYRYIHIPLYTYIIVFIVGCVCCIYIRIHINTYKYTCIYVCVQCGVCLLCDVDHCHRSEESCGGGGGKMKTLMYTPHIFISIHVYIYIFHVYPSCITRKLSRAQTVACAGEFVQMHTCTRTRAHSHVHTHKQTHTHACARKHT